MPARTKARVRWSQVRHARVAAVRGKLGCGGGRPLQNACEQVALRRAPPFTSSLVTVTRCGGGARPPQCALAVAQRCKGFCVCAGASGCVCILRRAQRRADLDLGEFSLSLVELAEEQSIGCRVVARPHRVFCASIAAPRQLYQPLPPPHSPTSTPCLQTSPPRASRQARHGASAAAYAGARPCPAALRTPRPRARRVETRDHILIMKETSKS